MTPGDGFRVADLDTRAGTVRVGLMICYDREFPESARVLMLGGAELILTPNACGLDADRLGQFRARAYENMVGVAMANYATPDRPPTSATWARSTSATGTRSRSAASGSTARAMSSTTSSSRPARGRSSRSQPSTSMRCALTARTRCAGDAYRKPAFYKALSDDTPLPVFDRADSRR